jgi:prepilin-type N-terminal cleavage/methylation domain-containing protein
MKVAILNNATRRRAWTLPEVMVAVALLALMAVSMFAAFGFGFQVLRSTRDDLRATQILTQKIESIRLCTWYQLTNQCPHTFKETYANSGSNAPGTVYYGTISLGQNTNLPSAYRANVQLVTVSLTWTNSSTANQSAIVHTRAMQTQSAYYGEQNYLYGVTNTL